MPRIRNFKFDTNAEEFKAHPTAVNECIERLPRTFFKALAELIKERENEKGAA